MAYARHAVWLEPEEQHEEQTLQVAPRRRPQQQRRLPKVHPVVWVLILGVSVGVFTAYTNCFANIAWYDYQRQAQQQQLAQLNRDCIELNLELDRLYAQAYVTHAAQQQGLELPPAERVHYVRVNTGVHGPVLAQSPAAPVERSWLARSKHQLFAALDAAWQGLRRGPDSPAYIHE